MSSQTTRRALLCLCSGLALMSCDEKSKEPAPQLVEPPKAQDQEKVEQRKVPPPPEEDNAPEDAPAACSGLTRTACMESADCTLVLTERGRPYLCREARPPCETGLRQTARGFKQACEGRKGCRFAPAECYCHCKGYGETSVPDGEEARECRCRCSGGPPNTCVADGS